MFVFANDESMRNSIVKARINDVENILFSGIDCHSIYIPIVLMHVNFVKILLLVRNACSRRRA